MQVVRSNEHYRRHERGDQERYNDSRGTHRNITPELSGAHESPNLRGLLVARPLQ
jgi:hypothetical protein